MGGLISFLVAYLLGGLTLLPLLGLAFYIYTSSPFGDPDPSKLVKAAIASDSPATPSPPDEAQVKPSATKGLPPRYGWMTARKSFKPRTQDGQGSSAPASPVNDPAQPSAASTYSSLLLRSVRSGKDASGKDGSPSPQPTHTYVPPPEFFYAACKGSILYLYTSETLEECHAVLDLQQHDVTFYPIDGLLDGEIYAKRNAIHLKPRKRATTSSLDKSMAAAANDAAGNGSATDGGEGAGVKRERSPTPLLHPTAWFLFVPSNIEMEDWYLALKHASSDDPHAPPLKRLQPVFSEQDMVNLIEKLDAEPDQIPMRWFNAIFGRIFLGINRTAWLEDFIKSKLHKKLHRLALPSFLSPLTVTQVSLSSPPPTFSRPMLKDLTPQGEASIEVFVSYPGELRVSVTTTATLSLGGRFKSYQVPLVLAVIIKEIEGDLRVRVKGPPSNRLWYGFSGEPKMTINVEPVVSATQIKWSLILKPIEKQLREVFHESVVLPNMDDIPWFDTTGLTRGGIFADAACTDKAAAGASPTAPGADMPVEVTVEPPAESNETLIDSPAPSLFSGSLRKRQGTTSSIETADTDARPAGHGVSRIETAPSSLEHAASTSTLGKKTWFGSKPITESIRAVSIKSSSTTKEKDEPVESSAASLVSVASSSETGLGARGRSASVPPLKVDSDVLDSSVASSSVPREQPATSPSKASLSDSMQADSEPSTSPTASNLTAASVVTAWRNRNTDKQALTNLGLEARNAAKKWGANWASKRKGGTLNEGSADEGEAGHRGGTSSGGSKDLFERLSAQLATPASAAAAQDPPSTSAQLPSLARSPSPGKGTSPVRAVPAPRGPTTALSSTSARDPSPSSGKGPAPPSLSPASSFDMRKTPPPTTHAPVRTQMGASKMMSIPSIPASRRSAEQSFSSQPAPAPGSSPDDPTADARSIESVSSSFDGRNRRLGSVYRLFGSVGTPTGGASASTVEGSSLSPSSHQAALEAGFIPSDEDGTAPAPVPTTSDAHPAGQTTPSSAPALPARPSPSVLGSATRGRSTSTSTTSHPITMALLPSSTSASSLAGIAGEPDEPTLSTSSSPVGSWSAQANLQRIAQLDRTRHASTPANRTLAGGVNPKESPDGAGTPAAAAAEAEDDVGPRPPPDLPPRSPLKPPPLPPRTPSSSSLPSLAVPHHPVDLASTTATDASPPPPHPPPLTPPPLAPPTTTTTETPPTPNAAHAPPPASVEPARDQPPTRPDDDDDRPPPPPPPPPVVSRSRSDSETRSVDGLFTYDEH